ncbi:MAG: hypothetical protein FWC95_05110 [Defluviitaleaceae bacterium]|nr:hypothetical protein [Defluviitaleaceae bacterium]
MIYNIIRGVNRYSVRLWYVCVKDINIVKQRVREFIVRGSHGISDDEIKHRHVKKLIPM